MSTVCQLLHGDCREVLRGLPDACFDAVVTDPPYDLTSKRPGGRSPATEDKVMRGFMGMSWDATGVAFDPATWREVLRVLKPGGHLVAFGGSRTFHRVACAVEDAGFEVRDTIMYLYGSGFPKSKNIDLERGRAICGCPADNDYLSSVRNETHDASSVVSQNKKSDLQQEMQRASTQGCIAQKTVSLDRSEGAESQDEGREEPGLERRDNNETSQGELCRSNLRSSPGLGATDGEERRIYHAASTGDGGMDRAINESHRGSKSSKPSTKRKQQEKLGVMARQRQPQTWGGWTICRRCGKPMVPKGMGTALKPAHEPIILARRPLDGTVADNLLRWGVGALNVDGCRVPADDGYVDNAVTQGINTSRTSYAPACARRTFEPSADGRWPANVAHDGSDEVLAAFPDAPGQIADAKFDTRERKTQNVYGSMRRERGDEPSADSDNNGAVGFKMKPGARRLDAGSAARFFYCAKASRADRDSGGVRSHHPTVKPVDLMRWLVRMVTPRGGLVLDPFAGSGSTGKACALEGANCVLVELTAEYLPIIRARCAAAGHAVLG